VPGARDRLSKYTALLVAAIAIGVTTRYGAFVPWGTDTGAYISQAESWAKSELFTPASFLFWTPWSLDAMAESPLGHRPGPVRGTIIGVYPLGFPLLLAASLKLAGSLAPYVVNPLFLGLLAWCAYVLASELSTGWAGAAASVLIAATPVALSNALMPMSDIPATALWMVSFIFSLRPGAGAAMTAGLSTAMAIMVRPNLAPLGAILALVILASDGPLRGRLACVIVYAAFAAIGPALVLWSHAVLYGDPFSAGYVGWEGFFNRERIPANARFYPGLLIELHTALVLAGVLTIPLALRRARENAAQRRAAIIAAASLGIIIVNYLLYLPYLTYEGWYWLRFMLPGLTVLFALFAAFVDWCRLHVAARSRLAAAVMVVPILYVAWHPQSQLQWVFTGNGMALRLALMGRYLREALPENAVVLTYLHSGAVAVYPGRPILRLDMVPPERLDTIIDDLRRHAYHPVFVLDRAFDGPYFRDRFTPSKYVRLDWPARAEFCSTTVVAYHDPVDRDAFFSGDRYPIDLLKWPATDLYQGSWSVLHVPMESIELPAPQESVMFMAALQSKYRDSLKRPALTVALEPNTSTTWVERYLRFRLHSCDHDTASGKVFQQIDGQGPQPLCQRPLSPAFPPLNETAAFRQQLERKFSGRFSSFVDLEGQAVWVQEYLRHRVQRCSHREAVNAVMAQIDGDTRPVACSSSAGN
jgi:hypothetical protein